mmetsp:Transcript_985/g.2998  ORF Transcript_985/g.2998 Transcript_985/m.2998 type:complete len:246 (-) Transcript_985:17-754(-)
MVEDSGGVDDLPPDVVVVEVPDEKRLSREGIRLHVHIRVGDNVHEGRLAHIGVACEDQRTSRRVDGRQTPEVLSDLFEVGQGPVQLLHTSAHAAKCGSLQHFALVEAVRKLHHLGVILGNVVYDFLRRVDLAQRQLVVITVIQHVAQIGVEGVDVVNLGELLQDLAKLLAICRLAVLHLPHVKVADSGDVETRVHHCRGLPLCLGQHDVYELLRRRNSLDLLKLVHPPCAAAQAGPTAHTPLNPA